MKHSLKYLGYLFCAVLFCAMPVISQANTFPRPANLQPNIDFWKRVYTEIDRSQGFLHDDQDLSIVYGIVNIPDNAGRAAQKRIVKYEKEKLRKILRRIADKPASSLSGRERQIRELFGSGVSSSEILNAASQIRFQLGQADKFRSAVSKSGIYMPYIQQQFVEAGLPIELSVLPFVESSFNIAARSHVGAAGIWQFMPGTGRRFMKVNHVVDERYDPYRATQAAIRLLQYNHDVLNSWPLALTAYNHGVAGMRRAVIKTGTSDIGDIVEKYKSRSFGFASRNFYTEFIAALDVFQNAEHHFPATRLQSPFDYTVFSLDHYVPAETLAQSLNVSVDTLRQHNLSLREPVWEGEKRLPANYDIRLPSNLVAGEIDSLLASIPESLLFNQQVADKTYRVQRGDSLSGIAALYRVSVGDLAMMNNLHNLHRIRAGQVLYLPQNGVPVRRATDPEVIVVASAKPVELTSGNKKIVSDVSDMGQVDQQESIAGEDATPIAEDTSHEQLEATDPADYSVAKDNTIEVQAAETLGHYAEWLGVRTNKLRNINRLSFRKPLVIGKRLELDFSKKSHEQFVLSREAYHKDLEDSFFATSQITGTSEYRVRPGDSLWKITSKQAQMPLWLMRQYNPDINFSALKPGERIIIPVIEDKGAS